MGVAYSSPDSSLTRLCAVYTCRCGANASEVVRHAGELPRGWEPLPDGGCMCAHCAEFVRTGKLPELRDDLGRRSL
jgi:hypothetical protein